MPFPCPARAKWQGKLSRADETAKSVGLAYNCRLWLKSYSLKKRENQPIFEIGTRRA
jgi:hypothetical protein